jgi:hypothetical protein
MNILFLDDSPERCKAFRAEQPSATIVNTAAEAIAALTTYSWNEVHLDHDLGGETFVDSSLPNTGMEVVRWICENKPVIGLVVVHTCNPPAGDAMVSSIENHGYMVRRCPFPWRQR